MPRARKQRRCEMCSGEYRYTYSKQRTCSRACGEQLRRQVTGTLAAHPKYPSSSIYLRDCTQCSTTFVARQASAKYCSDECIAEAAYESRYKRKRPTHRCAGCNSIIVPTRTRPGPAGACSDICRIELARRAKRENSRRYRALGLKETTHRARAKRFGVAYEPIDKADVYERDGWVCGLCSGPVDAELSYPEPMSASLDHVIPMARGGGHLRANVQLAHWQCNVDKGDRPTIAVDDCA